MNKPIVACIQHRLLVTDSPADYEAHLHRFLRIAKSKGARLAVFPELSGLGYAFPIFSGWRTSLLKSAGKGNQPTSGIWQRTKARLAGGAANVVKADLHQSLQEMLRVMPEALRESYLTGFSSLAQQYEMTIIAGSVYEFDPVYQQTLNTAVVFGPDGSILGRQSKVVLTERDRAKVQPADGWGVIPTPVGKVGILIGNDALFPEPSRILAYQGADMLISIAAVSRPVTYHKIHQSTLARCQENQLYGMVSFLVGKDPFAKDDAPPFVGKSGIFAPVEFTHHFTGLMVEVGSPLAEGVVTAEWDYLALEHLWQQSETPVRRQIPLQQAGPILANIYGSGIALDEADRLLLKPPTAIISSEEAVPIDIAAGISPAGGDDDDYPNIAALWPDATHAPSNSDELYDENLVTDVDAVIVSESEVILTPDEDYDKGEGSVDDLDAVAPGEQDEGVEIEVPEPETVIELGPPAGDDTDTASTDIQEDTVTAAEELLVESDPEPETPEPEFDDPVVLPTAHNVQQDEDSGAPPQGENDERSFRFPWQRD